MKSGGIPARRPRERGAALLLVVWAIGLMGVIAAIVARDAHLDARESRLIRETLSARLLAESGVRIALDQLPAGGRFPLQCDLATGRVWIDIRPVSSLIDVNTAQEETLAALFRVLGASGPEAAGMAARIADFRDGDATPRPSGAEAGDYQRAGLRHGPANRPLTRLGELSEVMALDHAIIAAALPHLTVHSHSSRVDPAYTTPEIAAALELAGRGGTAFAPDESWELGTGSQRTQISAGPVVIRVVATTPGGQRSIMAATYSAPRSASGSSRRLLEEHPADLSQLPPGTAGMTEARPCFRA